jgi:hypothetical protein
MMNQDNETIILNNPGTSDQDLEELFAIKALINNPNAVLQNVMGFEKFCFSVNGLTPSPEIMDVPNLLMVTYAVKKAEEVLHRKLVLIEPADHFTICYIAMIAYDEGWVILPGLLHFAQKELDKLNNIYSKNLFKNITEKELSEREPWDDDDPVSNHCAKMQTVIEYLKIMDKK